MNKLKPLFLSIIIGLAIGIVVLAFTNPSGNPTTGGGAISTGTNAPANSIYVKSDGNVGIGTVSPDSNYKITTAGGGIKAESTSQPAGYFSSSASYGLIVNSGNVGIGTLTPAYKLDVNGELRVTATSTLATSTFSGNVGIGTTGPGYKLDVVSGGATTARFGTAGTDTVVIGGGAGKISVGTIDPLFNIGGNKYATYMAGMTGVREETTGVIQLTGGKYVIDFDELEEGSDLWILYRTTDFGKNWGKLAILLSGEGPGKVWYQKNPAENQIILYGENSTSVSYRLTAPRFDWKSWLNVVKDGTETGLIVEEIINNQYTQAISK